MRLDFAPTGLAVASRSTRAARKAASPRPHLPRRLVGKPKAHGASRIAGPRVPHSAKLTGLEFRVTGVHVADNGTEWVWPLIRYSDLYVLAFVQSDLDPEPVGVTIDGFEDVDDNDDLPLDYAPYSRVFGDRDRFPTALHCFLSVVKSKAGIRDLGAEIDRTVKSPAYRRATSALSNVLSAAASAPAAAVANLVLPAVGEVAQVLGGILTDVADSVLSRHVASFTALNGDFDEIGRRDIAWEDRHCSVGYRLTVRGVSAK